MNLFREIRWRLWLALHARRNRRWLDAHFSHLYDMYFPAGRRPR